MKKLRAVLFNIKNSTPNKILDAVFVLIIFVLLFLPMMHIDIRGKKLYRENRMMAKWVPLVSETFDFNYNFGKDFEDWYKDRFFLRKFIVNTFMNLKYKMTICCYSYNKHFLNKKTNYMADVAFFNVPFDEAYIENLYWANKQIVLNLKKLEKFCNDHNIKLYVMVCPRKNAIGSENSYPLLVKQKYYLLVIRRILDIKNRTGIKILYPYYELTHNSDKDGLLYFKSDYHWTDIGANIAYKVFMQQVKKTYNNIKIYDIDDFNTFNSKLVRVCPVYGFFEGRYYNNLNLSDKKILDTEYTYLLPINRENIYESHKSYDRQGYIRNIYINKNNPTAPNLFLFGDSTSLNLLPGLVSSFRNTRSIFAWATNDDEAKARFDISKFEKEILDSKTDVLFILLCDINRLGFLYKK